MYKSVLFLLWPHHFLMSFCRPRFYAYLKSRSFKGSACLTPFVKILLKCDHPLQYWNSFGCWRWKEVFPTSRWAQRYIQTIRRVNKEVLSMNLLWIHSLQQLSADVPWRFSNTLSKVWHHSCGKSPNVILGLFSLAPGGQRDRWEKIKFPEYCYYQLVFP